MSTQLRGVFHVFLLLAVLISYLKLTLHSRKCIRRSGSGTKENFNSRQINKKDTCLLLLHVSSKQTRKKNRSISPIFCAKSFTNQWVEKEVRK